MEPGETLRCQHMGHFYEEIKKDGEEWKPQARRSLNRTDHTSGREKRPKTTEGEKRKKYRRYRFGGEGLGSQNSGRGGFKGREKRNVRCWKHKWEKKKFLDKLVKGEKSGYS